MRRPTVAGSFYPSNKEKLLAMLREFCNPMKDDRVIACVSPHAGYIYSGKTAGKIHSLLPDAETFVIIGPNHTGYGLPVAVSKEDWQTPLGVVKIDKEFVDALPKRIIVPDELAHRYEHSLEVQVPFLQYLHEKFKIVPICLGMQDEETAKEVTEEILEAEASTGKRVVVLASSDMHHYLPDDECRRLDKIVIDAILSMDVKYYYKKIYELQASVCGYGCIAVAMNYAKEKNGYAELVHYSTSGDVADKSYVVGYAGIAFKL
ncbi:MAG: MEMO1 family protein [Archaeoglobaceae archaeon]|nr:MEMO1 family protein [Archaeoglobaceae archaeon]MCX8152504.1 MEMO1 family protein [Archaeoglobaceae archaeon]MDW8013681.1 MEMO1 family protein [Archaeoglobaceae archaeon]